MPKYGLKQKQRILNRARTTKTVQKNSSANITKSTRKEKMGKHPRNMIILNLK